MAFHPSSRYAGLQTVEVAATHDRKTTIVKLRRLPPTEGDPHIVAEHDRLDILAHEHLGDSSEYWQIADANTELLATDLIEVGRVIRVPVK